jgi:hypothetical protein
MAWKSNDVRGSMPLASESTYPHACTSTCTYTCAHTATHKIYCTASGTGPQSVPGSHVCTACRLLQPPPPTVYSAQSRTSQTKTLKNNSRKQPEATLRLFHTQQGKQTASHVSKAKIGDDPANPQNRIKSNPDTGQPPCWEPS